jgi:thioredoxin 1
MAVEANTSSFENEVIKHPGRVLVDFYTPECGPCRFMTPLLEELGKDRPQLKIVKIDVGQNATVGAHFRVMGVPTFIIFDQGQPQKQITGSRSKKEFAAWLDA